VTKLDKITKRAHKILNTLPLKQMKPPWICHLLWHLSTERGGFSLQLPQSPHGAEERQTQKNSHKICWSCWKNQILAVKPKIEIITCRHMWRLRQRRLTTVSHCPARDISVLLSELYCTYHITNSTHTAAGLLPLLVHPPGTVSRTLSTIRTPPKLLSGAC